MSGLKVLGIIVIVAAIIAIGLLAFRYTEPNGEEMMPEFQEKTGSDAGQFLQRAPEVIPPVEDEAELSTTAQPENNLSTQEGLSMTEIISIDDVGFTPNTLTVPTGTTVRFINNGQGKHWPASDDHPTHNILSGFDSRPGLETGGEYSYQFTKAGSWNFHDHLNVSAVGTINVE